MLYKKEPLSWMVFIAAAAFSAFFLMDARHEEGPLLSGTYQGALSFAELKVDGDRLKGFAVAESGQTVYASYRIGSAEEKQRIEAFGPAVQLTVQGTYEEPKQPPHAYAFDMQRYLEQNNAKGMLAIETIMSAHSEQGILGSLAQQRKHLLDHIERTFPESLKVEAQALLLGERGGLDEEQVRIQRTLGITHLFAISGLHVGIITGMLYFLLLRLRVRKEMATLTLIILLPLYAVLAGAAPSVLRACSMVILVLIAKLIGIHVSVVQALTTSFIFFLLVEPLLLYDIGFQLSYGASFGIITSLKLLEGASFFKAGLIVTAVSQISLYPLLLFHFYEISLSSFFVNTFYVPLFTLVILPANFVLLALTMLPGSLVTPFFALYEPLRAGIAQLTQYLAEMPHQLWTPGKPGVGWVLFMVVSALVFFVQTEKRFRLKFLIVLVIPGVLLTIKPYADPALYVSFIDVGQGDSVLIELPYRRAVYLIDSGGVLRFGEDGFQKKSSAYEVGRGTVVPYLKGRGIANVDLFVLSHPDADHAEGADEVFEELAINRLHITPGSETTDLMTELALHSSEASVELPKSGAAWTVGKTQFMYLSPEDDVYEGNDDSLVLWMEHAGQRFLFTGDLEEKGERAVVENYGTILGGLAALKVGHHGSKTSSSQLFLEALEPKVSIVSAGIDNRYGHPSPEVTARFRELDLPLLSTAENGTIRIKVEDGTISVDSSRK